jgi:integrase
MTDTKHLWQRGHQWYLKLAIPRPLQKDFPTPSTGKPKSHIVEPLGDSLTQARLQRNRLVTAYEEVFARLRSGEKMTPDQIKLAVLDLQAVAEQHKARAIGLLPIWLRSLAEKNQPDQMPILRRSFESEVEKIAKSLGKPIQPDSDLYKTIMAALERGHQAAVEERLGGYGIEPRVPPWSAVESNAETINQAAEAWFSEIQSDATVARKQTTLDGHRLRVRAFIEHCGDIPLASVTRAMASDFLTKMAATGLSNRTVNNYATTLTSIFKNGRKRGRFTGDNPFEDQKRKVGGESYVPFEITELQKLFDSFQFETKPKQYSPATALPWVTLIATFTGMRLEEICQLNVADIRDQSANGATVTVIDIHNGGNNNLKNESSVRLVPVHSNLVQGGLLRYRDSLPKDSPLFPGLTRRASKGGKIGARLGELFRKELLALGIKRKGLCFHSLRHTVAGRLEAAEVSQTDAARVLGHTIPGMSYGTYSTGPGLKRLAAVIEEINYPGLVILSPET